MFGDLYPFSRSPESLRNVSRMSASSSCCVEQFIISQVSFTVLAAVTRPPKVAWRWQWMECGERCVAHSSVPMRRPSFAVVWASVRGGWTTLVPPIPSLQTKSTRPTCSAEETKAACRTAHIWGGRSPRLATVRTALTPRSSATMMVRQLP